MLFENSYYMRERERGGGGGWRQQQQTEEGEKSLPSRTVQASVMHNYWGRDDVSGLSWIFASEFAGWTGPQYSKRALLICLTTLLGRTWLTYSSIQRTLPSCTFLLHPAMYSAKRDGSFFFHWIMLVKHSVVTEQIVPKPIRSSPVYESSTYLSTFSCSSAEGWMFRIYI